MQLLSVYLNIVPSRYYFLKFILEGYDGLCLLSTVPDKKGCVCLRFPQESAGTLFALLTDIAKLLLHSKKSSGGENTIHMNQKSFFIKTFGCQMNDRDSEIMAQLLSESGYVETNETAAADLVILNTCSIRAKAEQKVMSLLGVLRKHKKKNPEMRIVVAGCVAQQEGQAIINRMPHVDLVLGTQSIYQLVDLLEKQAVDHVSTNLVEKYTIPEFIPNLKTPKSSSKSPAPFKKFLTIMQGCNNYCSYCVVPYTRGREISRSVSHILKEAKVLVDAGVKEITLLGQNVNSYGQTNSVSSENENYTFSDLLRAVAEIPGLQRLRFTTSNPKDLSDDLMRCFADIDILCHQFHLPVQSGSNAVLSRMNRKYTREHYLELVSSLRGYCPDIAITTDMIVGFPGESDQDFADTMSLQEAVRFNGSYSFKYSDRPGTRSADFDDKVDEAVKSERLLAFQNRQDEICLEYNKQYVGSLLQGMVEKTSKESIVARTGSNHLVHIKGHKGFYTPGEIISIRINHAGQHSLNGDIETEVNAIL